MAPAADALSSEQLVLGRFRPLRPLGSGGSGSVWLALDEQRGVEVALKIVARDGKAGPRAEREAAAAARLKHARCQRAHAFATDDTHVYLAYEYVPGRTLREAMRSGELGDAALVEAAAQVLDGLAHAHAQGIVHRDVKPANVLLADGPEVSVRLLDFGLAQLADADALTAPGDVPGTLAYIAPERLAGEPGSSASDVWSVGVILWEGLAGRHPFAAGSLVETARRIQAGAPSLATVRRGLPERLVRAVDRALLRDAAKRPAAAALASVLRQALRPEPARPPRRATSRAQVDLQRLVRVLSRPERAAARVVPALLAALLAGLGAAMLPFYPAGWAAGLAVIAGLIMLVAPRLSLGVALAVPIFPLGNVSAGIAVLYAAAALVWLLLFLGEPRAGPAVVAGPLLAAVAALGLLPLALLPVRSAVRRFALAMGAAVTAVVAAGLDDGSLPLTGGAAPHSLRLDATAQPLRAANAVWTAAATHPDFLFKAAVLGVAAAALPALRRHGRAGAAAAGVVVLVAALFPSPALASVPIALAAVVTTAVLLAEQQLPAAADR